MRLGNISAAHPQLSLMTGYKTEKPPTIEGTWKGTTPSSSSAPIRAHQSYNHEVDNGDNAMNANIKFFKEDGQPLDTVLPDSMPLTDLDKYLVIGDEINFLDGSKYKARRKVFIQVSEVGEYDVYFYFEQV